MTHPRDTSSDLEARLATLEANEELRHLAHNYCHGLDKRDLDRFLAIWTDDGEWAFGEIVFKGHDEIAKAVEDVWSSHHETHHWTTNHVMDWSGSVPRGTSEATIVVNEATRGWVLGSAAYEDEYARVDGRWLIRRREGISHFTRLLN